MENLEETDNITKNIVQEIVRECKKQKLDTDENFCVYYVKLLTLDPFWKISPEKKINRENIQNIVNFIIKKIQTPNSFDLVTLKIQHTFLSRATGRDNMMEVHKQAIKEVLAPLHDEIIAFAMDDSNKQAENKLFRKIALYSTLISGLGNPKHAAVLKEAVFALKSILEESDIPQFLELPPASKKAELIYFQNLVAGIRLFHRDCGRPSAEIEDLPRLLAQALIATSSELQNELLSVMEEVNLATSAIENVFTLKRLKNPKVVRKGGRVYEILLHLESKYPEGVTDEDVQITINLLILARQREVYIRKLLKDIQDIEVYAKRLFNALQQVLTKLHNVVKYKVAVSTNVVYPLFTELAETWRNIQDEAVLLSMYYNIIQKIDELNETVSHDFDKLKLMIGNGLTLTDAMRLEKTMDLKIDRIKMNACTVLDPGQIKEFDKLPLQYLGFCVWSLVETEGGLIPGNPNMGVIEYKNKYYAFSHPSAASEFGIDPDRILKNALSILRIKPELINLLQLHDSISEVRDVGVLYEKPIEVVMMTSSEVQTELHPIPENIDPDYIWNTWDYYRQAIKLANITQCQTHSIQTKRSHLRYSVHVQTTEPRDKDCQTKKDNYVNVATPSNYMFGLRGRKDDVQHVIDLTRPIDEKEFYTCSTAIENPPLQYQIKPRKCRSTKTNTKQVTPEDSFSDICNEPITNLPSDKESSSLEECICVTNLTNNI